MATFVFETKCGRSANFVLDDSRKVCTVVTFSGHKPRRLVCHSEPNKVLISIEFSIEKLITVK